MTIAPSVRRLFIALMCVGLLAPVAGRAEVSLSITIAPPPLPVYVQPAIPADGFIWTPGYWAYGPAGYFWVPGTWVEAPEPGLLWTPGYWGWSNGFYVWNAGYWGPHIGFYGGVNYGFGYFGHGYEGGYWRDNHFFYNRTINNIGVTNIHNVYSRTVVNNVTVNNVSYNGGRGGITARPSASERSFAAESHRPPTLMQTQHFEAAGSNRALLASVNHGRPGIAATARPNEFAGRGVIGASRSGAPTHPNELPRPGGFASPHTGKADTDQAYRNRQNEMRDRQQHERDELQQRQAQEHQDLANQRASQSRSMQAERQHQQQTQQLQQRHAVEAQQLRQAQRGPAPRQGGGPNGGPGQGPHEGRPPR